MGLRTIDNYFSLLLTSFNDFLRGSNLKTGVTKCVMNQSCVSLIFNDGKINHSICGL